MNAFTPVTETKHEYLMSVFPMLCDDYWTDSDSLNYRAISIWDHWLHERGDESKLEPRDHSEYEERCQKFQILDRELLSRTLLFASFGGSTWRFGEPINSEVAAEAMAHREDSDGFLALLPELRIIYTSGDNDHHTRTIWYQDKAAASLFFDLVEMSGLKIVGGRR